MCGIVALWSTSQAEPPIAPERLRRATDSLLHRGPDGRGEWLADDGRVGLGHTRLVLIDPLADQPLANEDGSIRIVVNGEFYDYTAIQRHLGMRRHTLGTRGDSEIAVHLYEDRGIRCLDALRGEFAFVLWDGWRRQLVAARDRFGIKPLFYAEVGGVLVLASEIKALLAAGVPAAWDEEAVYDSLHLAFDASRTLFQGIRQVPPAHVLIASDAGTRIERYWDIPYPSRKEAAAWRGDETETIEHVRALLDEAVRLRLQADVPVGALLSGGIDSSTVLALAARHSERPVAAFTVGFDGAAYDETEAARTTAEHVGAEFHLLPLSDRQLADAFPDAVCQGEGIQLNAHGAARYLLSREIRRAGYKTVMAGEGADELFAGYAFLRAAMPGRGRSRVSGRLGLAMRLARRRSAVQARLAETSPWLAWVSKALGFGDTALGSLVDRLDVVRGVLAPEFSDRFRSHDPYRSLYDGLDRRAELRHWEPAKTLLYLWLRTIFANYHMGADRLDMAHAVEVRLPYLDHVLVEAVSRIPVTMLAKDGHNKHVLREAARPFVPKAAYTRTKQPFLAPPASATPGNPLHELTQDTLRASSPSFIDRDAVIRLLDGLPSRPAAERAAVEGLLMALLSLSILDRRYMAGD